MRLGSIEFVIRRIRKYGMPHFKSKTALCKWIMKNINPHKTEKLTIDAQNESIEIIEGDL